jgi:hypothetical protein
VRVSPELQAELGPVVEVAAAERFAVAERVVRTVAEAGALQLQLRPLFPRQPLPAALVPPLKCHRHRVLQLPC